MIAQGFTPISEDERAELEAFGITKPSELPQDPSLRAQFIKGIRHSRSPKLHVPRWRLVSGLHEKEEPRMTRDERRHRVRRLVNIATLMIRKELYLQEADPEKSERTIYWEPVQEILRHLGIARSKLSSYMRELTGLSLSQTVDCVRVVGVKTKMRDALRAFLKSNLTAQHGDAEALSKANGDKDLEACATGLRRAVAASAAQAGRPAVGCPCDRWAAWKALRASRRWPEFSHGTWAAEYGFSSYTRFYRACMVVYGCSPHQLELKILDELLNEEAGQTVEPEHRAPTLEEVNARLKELIPEDYWTDPQCFEPKL